MLLAKRDEFYKQALAALTDKYSFTFAATYQKTTTRTALLDAEFDFGLDRAAAASLLAEALDGNFRRLLTEPSPAVRLHPAMLTHEIKRTTHVEVHLPWVSRTNDGLTTSLANVTAQDDDGRVLAYDLKASDLVTQKNLRNSRVAVAAELPVRKGVGVRVHSTEGLSYSYAFRQAVRGMKSADVQAQFQPYLETYFARLFTGDARPSTWIADMDKLVDTLEFNGTENFGNVLVSLELGLPSSVAGAWLNAPADERAPSYMEMSRRIQRKLKELIPFYYLADVSNLQRHDFVSPLLVYASIPESTDIDFDGGTATINPAHPRGLYWDFEDGRKRSAMILHHDAVVRLGVLMAKCRARLMAASMSDAQFYEPGQIGSIRSAATGARNGTILQGLLSNEAQIIDAARRAGQSLARFRAEGWRDPERAVAALADFGARITQAFNAQVHSVYGGGALRPLGTMLFVEAARAFLPGGADARPSALFELTVVRQASSYDLATFLAGHRPPAADVVVAERLATLD